MRYDEHEFDVDSNLDDRLHIHIPEAMKAWPDCPAFRSLPALSDHLEMVQLLVLIGAICGQEFI
jgi:hypothetical protein